MDGQENQFNDFINNFKNKGKEYRTTVRIVFFSVIVIALLVLTISSAYFLGSNEEAVIMLFGKHVRTEKEAGLKFKFPLIEEKIIIDIECIRRMEFGYRTINNKISDVILESRMLTADENLVIADWAIMYKVSDSYKYLFNVDDQENSLRTITEAAYRRIVASHTLDDILTDQKESIQFEVKESLQKICNKYDFGLTITAVQLQDAMPPDPVKSAFLEVASAKEDKNSKINDAKKYENEKLPVARGEAEQILNQAEAYKQQRINEATGVAARFLSIQKEYSTNTAVTKTRLYLEVIKSILPGVKEIFIMNDNGDVLKFLPMETTN
jgi:membrane protease subunit HflK